MLTRARWLGVAALFLFCTSSAYADNVLKPYVVLMLDTSGSMNNSTSAGPPTCGGRDNRLNHARCAINKIVNSYGDMVFALGRFRMSAGGTFSSSCDANGDVAGGGADDCTSSGNTCTSTDDAGEMLTGLVDGGNQAASTWTDFSCATCGGQVGTPLSAQPEIWAAGGNTPLGGYLQSAWDYWKGIQLATADNSKLIYSQNMCVGGTRAGAQCTTNSQCGTGGTCTAMNVGFDPIRNDPLKAQFLPTGCDPNPTTCATNNNCCDTQCRPYITIMLTDGDETCSGNAEPVAASMLNTVVDNREYKIETKVIGFGVQPGDTDIERYAHAGGAVDVPGKFEGYYVNDEASLQLALAQILADAVKVETCNNKDDDCDGNVDEDFLPPKSIPGKGGTCSNGQLGACHRDGALQCRADGAGLDCNAPTVTPGNEGGACNGIDDDCDGRIDEGLTCTQCVPTAETCDGNDNDCDGVPDQVCRCSNDNSIKCDGSNGACGAGACDCQPITRPCGTNACAGTETCTAPNVFSGCTAQTPSVETCDGVDNDCDGVCDGLTVECSDIVTPNGPGTDNPGSSGHNPQPIAQNICRPGLSTCGVQCGGTNSFTACAGEILPCNGQTPCTDPCNGLDDDCDNKIDEDFAEADCSTNCGTGKTVCQAGSIVCNSVTQGNDDNCNNVDEDCDGKTDEGWTCPGGNCDCSMDNGVPVCDGQLKCSTGQVICDGGPVNPEICNCLDDDCDGQPDNAPPGQLCPGGGTCVNCQCAEECTTDEFPCPIGRKCKITDAGNYCVTDPCFNVMCSSPTSQQTCIEDPNDPQSHVCVDTCALIDNGDQTDGYPSCPTGLVCVDSAGECRPDTCETFPDRCASSERCIGGTCVADPCVGVTCDTGQYCVGGSCVASCSDVNCPDGQRCRQGACEEDPCGEPCPAGQECNDSTGHCIEDPCKFRECATGEWCNPNDGQCETDPCQLSQITCPDPDDTCKGGTCGVPVQAGPDGGATFVTVGGGGCNTGGADSGLLLALALGVFVSRRRRTAGGAL